MDKTFFIKHTLYNYYGNMIHIGEGSCSYGYSLAYNIRDGAHIDCDFVVYIHTDLNIAIVWNNKLRKEVNATTKNFTLSNPRFKEVDFTDDSINHYIRTVIGSDSKRYYQKILAMKTETLLLCYKELYNFLNIHEDDIFTAIPEEGEIPLNYDRGRSISSSWNRDSKFRAKVLKRYNYTCAICRCTEPKILQAAHIKAVSEFGSDSIENGICLCANHHLMMDRGLLEINYNTKTLYNISDTLKNMTWYKEFYSKYNGKILNPK